MSKYPNQMKQTMTSNVNINIYYPSKSKTSLKGGTHSKESSTTQREEKNRFTKVKPTSQSSPITASTLYEHPPSIAPPRKIQQRSSKFHLVDNCPKYKPVDHGPRTNPNRQKPRLGPQRINLPMMLVSPRVVRDPLL